MLQHYNNCPRKPAKCPYASAGCKFEVFYTIFVLSKGWSLY